MFGFFASPEKKMRDSASNWLEVAERVFRFRSDLLSVVELEELQARRNELRAQVKERAPVEKLELGIKSLAEVLSRTGGAIYPKTALVENVEFFLVAAIVILGIRTYFVQPFKIPTNSMWPTYNGMTSEVFKTPAEEPGVPAVAMRGIAFGAWPHRLDAPDDGEVLIPIEGPASRGMVWARKVRGRSWLVIPTDMREYVLFVGDRAVTVTLPWDFDFDWTVYEAFLANGAPYTPNSLRQEATRRAQADGIVKRYVEGREVACIRTGKRLKRGERLLAFDELTGDQLLVDRVSYHFVAPSVGSGFVFRTGNIPGVVASYGDQYYIKRLVGTPGDRLELRAPGLFRNGQPIDGSTAFEGNSSRTRNYLGYEHPPRMRPDGRLKPGEILDVPKSSYFAMGDNSPNSEDSRYWGFVPAPDVVGRPIFVYFPFTRHWGPAK